MSIHSSFVSLFVPITDGKFDRPLLWDTPRHFMITNGVCFLAALTSYLVAGGWTHNVAFGFMTVFLPMTTASVIAGICTAFGYNPYR